MPRIEWDVPAYVSHVHPPLTAAAIRAAEKRLGLRLPSEYLAALREQNGGSLRYGWRGYASRALWGIGADYPSILKGSVAQQFEDVDDVWLPRKANKLVPFAGDGHWYLCFDARGSSDSPAVAYVDIESEHHRVVAPSFAQFLTVALRTRDENLQVGVVTKLALEEAAKRLGSALRMTISHQDASLHGYEMFHGASKRRGGAQLWISRNEVARGFAMSDDDVDPAVRHLLAGTALRHRRHPDCTLIVEVRDLSLPDVLEGCARADLVAREL